MNDSSQLRADLFKDLSAKGPQCGCAQIHRGHMFIDWEAYLPPWLQTESLGSLQWGEGHGKWFLDLKGLRNSRELTFYAVWVVYWHYASKPVFFHSSRELGSLTGGPTEWYKTHKYLLDSAIPPCSLWDARLSIIFPFLPPPSNWKAKRPENRKNILIIFSMARITGSRTSSRKT